jgi:hypothetical protein
MALGGQFLQLIGYPDCQLSAKVVGGPVCYEGTLDALISTKFTDTIMVQGSKVRWNGEGEISCCHFPYKMISSLNYFLWITNVLGSAK